MRLKFIAAVSSIALLASAAHAAGQDAAPAQAAVPASADYTDAQLTAFNGAVVKVRTISEAVQGGAPTAEQQAEMAAAVSASGLGIEQFNALSAAVSQDPILRARLAVITAPEPAAGSVGAGVTDAEVDQFSSAMVKMRDVAPAGGAAPTTEQQAEMATTVAASGLAVDRFNAIATAVSQDARLRARVELADAQRAAK